MKKLNTDLIIILLAILFIFGSVFLMFSLEAQEEAVQIRQEQDRIALYLVNHYEGVEKIEFTQFEKNGMTSSWYISANLNEDDNISITLHGLGGEFFTATNDNSFHLVKREQVLNLQSLDKSVSVYYYRR